ncbi:hypothetical protein E1B28_002442 [Marasmius oreades]|uniref:Uncharacterized protein n=1 Tax=Marasmius oreades TaxID=181124 RepID=A0A9P7ULE6_9AGAR|nr:uncharacterized protein E1B28_002442 [Marasmius oreades]KAG7086493.1 hypothetical protein E1B28_002442 [Marasmius oreades]
MAGTKRSSEGSGPNTRASKAAKTDRKATAGGTKKGGKKGAKAALPASTFKSKALPLHVNVTHTPPTIPDDETVPAATADPGFLGSMTLVPSTFNTGSYGWKGSKRVTIELQNGEGEENEKVQVMLTFNATVVGSKGAAGEHEETKDEGDAEEKGDETAKGAAEENTSD